MSTSHLAVCAAALLLGSCAQLGFPATGSGVRASVTRDVGTFHSVEIDVAADARVRIGQFPSVTLSGDDDLLEHVTTEVRRGRLRVALDEDVRFREPLRIEIVAPRMTELVVAGSGDIELENVREPELTVAIEGSGDVVASGEVGQLSASTAGSGVLRLQELRAREAHVSIHGSGGARVHVTQALRYRIDGSGDVRYAGDPELSGGISGSGSVRRR